LIAATHSKAGELEGEGIVFGYKRKMHQRLRFLGHGLMNLCCCVKNSHMGSGVLWKTVVIEHRLPLNQEMPL